MTLKQFLNAEKIRALHFAKKTGISPASISRYINGIPASKNYAVRISRATSGRVSVEELLFPKGMAQ